MKTPLLEYVPLEEDEEKGTVTNTTNTPQEEEEDETDPEFIAYMQKSRQVYWENKSNRRMHFITSWFIAGMFLFLATRDIYRYIYLRDPLCTNERGQALFTGQPYTIYATGNNDTIYSPTAITVPSEEHCKYLKQCSKSFSNVLCFVKPSYVKMLWTLDIEEEDAGTLPPINQFNAGL